VDTDKYLGTVGLFSRDSLNVNDILASVNLYYLADSLTLKVTADDLCKFRYIIECMLVMDFFVGDYWLPDMG